MDSKQSFAADIINQGIQKLEGIHELGKEYGFDLKLQVSGSGDSDNDLECGVGIVGCYGEMAVASAKRGFVKTRTTGNQQDWHPTRPLEHFGVLASESVSSVNYHFNKVKTFHHDG